MNSKIENSYGYIHSTPTKHQQGERPNAQLQRPPGDSYKDLDYCIVIEVLQNEREPDSWNFPHGNADSNLNRKASDVAVVAVWFGPSGYCQ